MASRQGPTAAEESNAEEPPSKKQKGIDLSARVELDVGGAKFVTRASTLSAHSSYFASLLSDYWNESRDCDGDVVFLDQDPVAFGKLLAYMRRGVIKVEDIDVDVMALAEFFGVEKLLRAIKIRWYINIGRGPVLSDDDEIVASFDRLHGGIRKALSSGNYQYFLRENDVDAEKDFAILTLRFNHLHFHPRDMDFRDYTAVVNEVKEGVTGPDIRCGGILGALNGIYANGYVLDDDQSECHPVDGLHTIRFSRGSHSTMVSSATDVFVPTQRGINCIKQFVIHVRGVDDGSEKFVAPAAFDAAAADDDGNNGDNDLDPYAEFTFSNDDGNGQTDFWLEKHNFVMLENELHQHYVLKQYLLFLCRSMGAGAASSGIYSRWHASAQKAK